MNYLNAALVLLVTFAFASCKTISDEAKTDLQKPVNCQTAREDVLTLEKEKASTTKRITAGVKSVVPASLVQGILTGDSGNRASVATGDYNKQIDAKIKQIHDTCEV